MKLEKINKEISNGISNNDRSNAQKMSELRFELEKEIAQETQVYKEKYYTYLEKQEIQLNEYEQELIPKLDESMKYESPN